MAPIHNTPVLITGGAGFFGSILTRRLLDEGHGVVIDLQDTEFRHERLTAIKGDIRDRGALERLFETHRFKSVFHCAAILAHAVKDKTFLWESNVDGTRNVAEAAGGPSARRAHWLTVNG
jgi:UDP-glucose 4-epimerase